MHKKIETYPGKKKKKWIMSLDNENFIVTMNRHSNGLILNK